MMGAGKVAIATFNTPADTQTSIKVFNVPNNPELSHDE
jgi:hypothetical protein